MREFRITVKVLQSGQAGAYQDSLYHYRVLVETEEKGNFQPAEWGRRAVENWCQASQPWKVEPEWYEPHLEKLEKVEAGLWDFQVRRAFTD